MTDQDVAERQKQQELDRERVRQMQPEQVPIEGGKPKQPLNLGLAYAVTLIASLLPVRLRVWFTFLVNFFTNNIYATIRLGVAYAGRAFLHLLILMAYWLVLGPTSLIVRLTGADYLRESDRDGSLWEAKEPQDETEARFERQF